MSSGLRNRSHGNMTHLEIKVICGSLSRKDCCYFRVVCGTSLCHVMYGAGGSRGVRFDRFVTHSSLSLRRMSFFGQTPFRIRKSSSSRLQAN